MWQSRASSPPPSRGTALLSHRGSRWLRSCKTSSLSFPCSPAASLIMIYYVLFFLLLFFCLVLSVFYGMGTAVRSGKGRALPPDRTFSWKNAKKQGSEAGVCWVPRRIAEGHALHLKQQQGRIPKVPLLVPFRATAGSRRRIPAVSSAELIPAPTLGLGSVPTVSSQALCPPCPAHPCRVPGPPLEPLGAIASPVPAQGQPLLPPNPPLSLWGAPCQAAPLCSNGTAGPARCHHGVTHPAAFLPDLGRMPGADLGLRELSGAPRAIISRVAHAAGAEPVA